MPRVEQRNTVWMAFLLILMVIGGLCAVGYWQTFDMNCPGNTKTWSWAQLPPKYKCSSF